MINQFLNAKHWQLFLLTFGLPIIFQIMMMGSMFVSFSDPSQFDTFFDTYFTYYPIIMAIYMFMYFGWFWSIVIGFRGKIPDQLKVNLNKFKFFFFFPIVYMLIISTFIGSFMSGILNIEADPDIADVGIIFAIIIPLHLFSMFCIFYTLNFVAKTIKIAELQHEVRFSDYAGEFFLMWFFPIGVWIIQPRINKISSTSD